MACKWVRFAYRVLPLPVWRAFLLDRHIDGCPSCQSVALGAAAMRSLGVTPADLLTEPPLSPFSVQRRERPRALRRSWIYAMGVFLVAGILWAAVVILRIVPPGTLAQGTIIELEAEDEPNVFAVIGATIGNEPARSVVFKPGQPGMTIVWFEKIKN